MLSQSLDSLDSIEGGMCPRFSLLELDELASRERRTRSN